jgi:glycosyltransferase involved in cell wall biosynthesis
MSRPGVASADAASRDETGADAARSTHRNGRHDVHAGTVATRTGAARRTVGSIVIPAHNEAAVIGRGLDRLFDALGEGVEVVVACNGCTDATAEVVRNSGHPVTVIALETPSKPAALMAAEAATRTFPRVYLDADVLAPGAAIRAVIEHLGRDGALAARPPLVYDTSASSWVVRRFYRARAAVPAVMGSLWGAGVYALSSTGRDRFDEFPALVADDLFVDRLFRRDEIELVGAVPVVVVAPATTSGLLASFRRAFRGNRAMTGEAAGGRPGTRATVRDLLRLACRGPAELLDATVYATVVVAARALAWRLPRSSGHWERDETSRR